MITRFAPSPTGPMHLGHAFAAFVAADQGDMLLRIEDLDRERSKPEWETLIYEDIEWLGLSWPTPVMRQSDRIWAYEEALHQLDDLGLIYPCQCNRADIAAATTAPQEGAPGPDGPVYPGTCSGRTTAGAGDALRLNMAKAVQHTGDLSWLETGTGRRNAATAEWLVHTVGDVVLRRRSTGAIAYHLAVVVDDADQNVSVVTRGEDLTDATAIHVLLQRLLGLPTPIYHHHRLIRDDTGKRLAKRDDARALRLYREQGASPLEIRKMIGL